MSDAGPLSIGLASPSWPASAAPNGIITYVSSLDALLRSQGHQVSILSIMPAADRSDPRVYDAQEAHLGRSPPRHLSDAIAYRLSPGRAVQAMRGRAVAATARRMVAERRLDVFEMEETYGTAAWVQRAVPIPVCVRLHGPWILTGKADANLKARESRARVRAEGIALGRAAAVSAPARDVLERVRAHYQLPLEDAEVIPNPLMPPPASQHWTLDGCDRSRILFVGRFDRLKGADLIIEAFGPVLRRFPAARLTLVGPDGQLPGANGRLLGLEDFVRERLPGALEARQVEWLGVQPPAAIGPLRRGAMVTVVPSRYETFSYTVAEAMVHGCPLVAADVGGVKDLIRNGETGLLHRPGDGADLAEKVTALLEHPDRAAALGQSAARYCQAELSPERVVARQIALYRRVIARFKRETGGPVERH